MPACFCAHLQIHIFNDTVVRRHKDFNERSIHRSQTPVVIQTGDPARAHTHTHATPTEEETDREADTHATQHRHKRTDTHLQLSTSFFFESIGLLSCAVQLHACMNACMYARTQVCVHACARVCRHASRSPRGVLISLPCLSQSSPPVVSARLGVWSKSPDRHRSFSRETISQ